MKILYSSIFIVIAIKVLNGNLRIIPSFIAKVS